MTRHHPHLRLIGSDTSLLLIAAAAGATKAAELDRELLACCREADSADRQAASVMDGIELLDDDDPTVLRVLDAARPLFNAYSDALDRAAQLAARTPEGLRAKAGLLLQHLRGGQDHDALAASLARDVVGRSGT